jgi:site-specific DNA-cytosine methylase
MKIGGLFSGVGGFELAWTQLGHEVAWMCEIDKNARKVLNQRFPGVPVYEDVEQLDPAEVEAVDVLTGGSPCQGFSVAGTRAGLEHGESRLFADYIRIMDGLAQRGLRYAIWENVPGVISIENDNGERTFEHVVAALAGGTVPVRLDSERRWNTGLAVGQDRAVAWRVLDSRYFGVAQRRRRIFACVAFGDSAEDRAGRSLLALPQGMSRDPAKGGPPWESSSRTVEGSADVPSVAGTLGAKGSGGIDDLERMTFVPEVVGALKARSYKGINNEELQTGQAIVQEFAPTVTSKWAKGTGGPSGSETGNLVLDNAQAFNWQSGGDARGLDLTDEASALTCQQTPAVFGMLGNSGDESISVEEQPALTASHGQPGNVAVPQAFQQNQRDEVRMMGDQAGALAANPGVHQQNYLAIPEPWGFSAGNSKDARSIGAEQGVSPPIRASSSGTNQAPTVGPIAQAFDEMNFTLSDQHHVLRAGTQQSTGVVEEMVDFGRTSDRIRMNAETAATLQAGGGGAGAKTGLYMVGTSPTLTASNDPSRSPQSSEVTQQVAAVHAAGYGVRRLTPVECERLQGFPDGWTEPTGSDSARYKAMGNAVTVNTVRWILGRILATDEAYRG